MQFTWSSFIPFPPTCLNKVQLLCTLKKLIGSQCWIMMKKAFVVPKSTCTNLQMVAIVLANEITNSLQNQLWISEIASYWNSIWNTLKIEASIAVWSRLLRDNQCSLSTEISKWSRMVSRTRRVLILTNYVFDLWLLCDSYVLCWFISIQTFCTD